MNKLVVALSVITIVWVIYKAFTFHLFLRLRNRLKDGNIDTFTAILGDNYEYRFLNNGLMRYKWCKRWMIIRANFDESGKLICNRIMPNILFTLKSEILFVSQVQ